MYWGRTSKQYLSVSAGGVYYPVANEEASTRPSWVYMVVVACIGEPLRDGGWAPPSLFTFNGMEDFFYEVELPIIMAGDLYAYMYIAGVRPPVWPCF
jgi:hypothetical protein